MITKSTQNSTLVRVSRETFENLIYLRATLEPQVGRLLSFNKLLNHISSYLIKKLEDDEFEKEIVNFIMEEGEDDR
jgi:hypothetical protein